MDQVRHEREELYDALRLSDGRDSVVVYVEDPKSKYPLPANWNVNADEELLGRLVELYGTENVRVV